VSFDPIAAYDGKAGDYAAHRLPYARAAIDWLAEATGLAPTWVVADIASGTGHLTKLLAGRARRIYAVEPNDQMRLEAQRALSGDDTVEHVVGRAEDTTLPASSIDLITVGQALHWFDLDAAGREFGRVLRPGGWIAVVWNRLGSDPGPDMSRLFTSAEAGRSSFPMSARESWEQYIGGTRSAAAAPARDDPAYAAFERTQRERFDAGAVDGRLAVDYSTEVAVGVLRR
jgi:SAM-dependent methyltransferase